MRGQGPEGTTGMSNLDIVKSLYQAFAAKERDRILEIFDPEIEWIQNEGFPHGGRHVGAGTVLDEVFPRFGSEWEVWKAVPERWLDAGDAVVALGVYSGTHKTTGKSMRAAFAHVYWVRDGRIVRFEQYTDTLKIAEAMR
jgi:ketosteroid isomerase-like protein